MRFAILAIALALTGCIDISAPHAEAHANASARHAWTWIGVFIWALL